VDKRKGAIAPRLAAAAQYTAMRLCFQQGRIIIAFFRKNFSKPLDNYIGM
jgi:hypothetical protein